MLQGILFTAPCVKRLVEQLRDQGPVVMTDTVAKASADVQEIIAKGFGVYEDGKLLLIRDAKPLA